MEKNNNFSDITLEQLAQMIAKEFASIRNNMATKDEQKALQKETQAGFAYINVSLDKHSKRRCSAAIPVGRQTGQNALSGFIHFTWNINPRNCP